MNFAKLKLQNASPAAVQAATILSAVEVGLGSLLHAFHVPLAGQCLSINQAFLLSRAVSKNRGERSARTMPSSVSNIAAILKSLSPAGKKLTPMLAISAQGFLMSLGTLLFGANVLGCAVGSVLLGFWAFLQPIAFYYLLFGEVLVQAGQYYLGEQNLALAVVAAFTVKSLACLAAAIGAFALPRTIVLRYEQRMIEAGEKLRERVSTPEARSFRRNVVLSFRDLLNPIFLVSIAMTCFFFYFAQKDSAQAIWAALRPVALGFLGFLLARTLPLDRLLPKLSR
ncbi:MAG: hypothetical protein V4760_15070 [Bdellovibrionota bacterium]